MNDAIQKQRLDFLTSVLWEMHTTKSLCPFWTYSGHTNQLTFYIGKTIDKYTDWIEVEGEEMFYCDLANKASFDKSRRILSQIRMQGAA